MRQRQIKDLTGNKYGRLTVVGLDHVEEREGYRIFYWKLVCECGNEVVLDRRQFATKHKSGTKSCGCLKIESAKKYASINSRKHGDYKTRFYKIWNKMKERCNNPNSPRYDKYGARGIAVCKEWNDDYLQFKKDMYDSYCEHVAAYGEKDTELDRIDVNKNYYKENCRWATKKQQARNKTTTVYVIMDDGTEIPMADLADKLNLSLSMLRHRYVRSEYYKTYKIPYNKLIKDKDIVSTSTEM